MLTKRSYSHIAYHRAFSG